MFTEPEKLSRACRIAAQVAAGGAEGETASRFLERILAENPDVAALHALTGLLPRWSFRPSSAAEMTLVTSRLVMLACRGMDVRATLEEEGFVFVGQPAAVAICAGSIMDDLMALERLTRLAAACMAINIAEAGVQELSFEQLSMAANLMKGEGPGQGGESGEPVAAPLPEWALAWQENPDISDKIGATEKRLVRDLLARTALL